MCHVFEAMIIKNILIRGESSKQKYDTKNKLIVEKNNNKWKKTRVRLDMIGCRVGYFKEADFHHAISISMGF